MTRLMIAALVLALLILGFWWINTSDNQPHEIQLSMPSDVASANQRHRFVGTAACIDCHTRIADRHSTSGHANTFHVTADFDLAKRLNGTEFEDTLRKKTFQYHFDQEGLSVSLPSVFGKERFPLSYALGSGTHAVTFLSLLPHRDGRTVGLEHRATYYSQLQGLGLTVGHPFLSDPVENAEHFGRVLDEKKLVECLDCHTTEAVIADHKLVRLIPHVSCEKCHGPGRDHVEAKQAGVVGPDVSTAHRWPTAIEELRTCGDCHRLPESLKPSELVRSSRVLPRFQPAGLMQSRCFTKSDGALRCTTCHDPHGKASNDTTHYERICLECHRPDAASSCRQSDTGCINCHMPKVAFEGVASFHDHWIRVRNDEDPASLLPVPSGGPR